MRLLAFSPMTARTRSTIGPSDGRRRGADSDGKPGKTGGPREPHSAIGRLGWRATPTRLRIALLVSIAGAVLTCVGVRMGLVVDGPPPAFASGPLLIVLAVAPAVLAVGGVLLGHAPTAAGILAGTALLAPGLALIDAQFLSEALDAARPEIMVPTSLAALTPANGLYLLLAGHVLAAVAGVLAVGRAGAGLDSDYYAALDASIDVRARGRAVGWALAFGAIAALGLLFSPFRSDNAFIVAHDLIAGPSLVRYGGLLVVLTVLGGCVLAAGSPRPPVARGIAIGLFAGLSWLVVPQLAAVWSVDWLHAEPWPLLTIVPVGLFVAALFLIRGDRPDADEIELDTSPLHLVTGILGVLTGVAALIGSFGALVVLDSVGDQPVSYANRQLLPAGILIILLAVLLFTRWAGAIRPAFVVALGSVAVVGVAALDAAFTATTAGNLTVGLPVAPPELHVGAGGWFTVAAVVFAAAAAVVAGVAGGAERDDVDLSRRTFHSRYAIPAGGAVLFAIGAFASPMITAPDYTAPGILTEFRLSSWGLLIGLLVVVGAAVVAALARPVRAAALLFGAAVVVGVHLLETPMTGDRVAGAQAGAGTWLSLACLVALLVAAVAAMTDPSRHESSE
jgi:hypothetical protein